MKPRDPEPLTWLRLSHYRGGTTKSGIVWGEYRLTPCKPPKKAKKQRSNA